MCLARCVAILGHFDTLYAPKTLVGQNGLPKATPKMLMGQNDLPKATMTVNGAIRPATVQVEREAALNGWKMDQIGLELRPKRPTLDQNAKEKHPLQLYPSTKSSRGCGYAYGCAYEEGYGRAMLASRAMGVVVCMCMFRGMGICMGVVLGVGMGLAISVHRTVSIACHNLTSYLTTTHP